MEKQATPTAPIDHYEPLPGSFDELVEPTGEPREHAERLVASLREFGAERMRVAGERRDRIFVEQGITYDTTDPEGQTRDRPFPLDLIPRIIPGGEWEMIERGVRQRVMALNRFVADVYSSREIVHDGIVPWALLAGRPGFQRAAQGIEPPGGVWCHVCGCDLVRGEDGRWKVLEDNVRVPSGISYVLENRIAMSRLVPELFAGYAVRPVSHYPDLLLEALRAVAPGRAAEPTVVVWTPGPSNAAYFEHAFLARQMGVELIEAGDMVVRDATCYMRTTTGLERVDAIYRRLDDDWLDPLELRTDSLLGVPGLMRAFREGNVAIANAVGTGVADDKAIYHYVPEMIRYYLDEEPVLDNVPTMLMSDEDQRAEALGRAAEMVFKPTNEAGGVGVLIGPRASEDQLAAQIARIEASPGEWIAQDIVWLSAAPTMTPEGGIGPRRLDLRPFAVFGETVKIVPGGLTRVALVEGSMIVNSSRGGGSKDTWVLAGAGTRKAPPSEPFEPPTMTGMRHLGWSPQTGQQQQLGDSPQPGDCPRLGGLAP